MLVSVSSPDELVAVAGQLLAEHPGSRVFAFYGAMGAGKTTFIKAICRALGVTDIVLSPTFSIINEYKDLAGNSLYHFDFYRIKNIREAYDIGYEEYFYSGSYCFIEWPELIENLLPEDAVKVTITTGSDEVRNIAF
ncbi:MAG TPA: tRNA (adenosine(37)-N6)-threonylcarbamoyltransferase complex ATPase subunit type 1 TsaE [Bacteroidales bacterium]|nr:tRNA (adenosine(37)-N6)-threonylcarbamoyltransferase complex ATPase subunit type 1 TsaE [Bacteroidales bacterium]